MKTRLLALSVAVIAFSLAPPAIGYHWVAPIDSFHLGVAMLGDGISLTQPVTVRIHSPTSTIAALGALSFCFVATPSADLSRLQAWTIAGHVQPLDSDPEFWCSLPDSSNQAKQATAGRSEAATYSMNTQPLQSTRALASGG